jgi:hypothetical protein
MGYLADRHVVIGKLEAVSGTPETLVAADFNAITYDPEYTPMIESTGGLVPAIGSHARTLDYSGAKYGQFKFKYFQCPGAAASTPPNTGKFLQAAGHVGAAISTTGYKWSPLAAGDEKTMTLWFVRISRGGTPVGIVHKIAGAMADGSISASGAGKLVEVDLTFTGKHVTATDLDNSALTTLNVLTAPDAAQPYYNSNTTVKYANTARATSAWKLIFGNKVEPEIDTADSNGGDVRCFAITSREPAITVNPQLVALSTLDPVANTIANTLIALDIALASRSPALEIIAPQCQVKDNPKFTKREGLDAYDITFKLEANGTPASKIDANLAWDEVYQIRQGTV